MKPRFGISIPSQPASKRLGIQDVQASVFTKSSVSLPRLRQVPLGLRGSRRPPLLGAGVTGRAGGWGARPRDGRQRQVPRGLGAGGGDMDPGAGSAGASAPHQGRGTDLVRHQEGTLPHPRSQPKGRPIGRGADLVRHQEGTLPHPRSLPWWGYSAGRTAVAAESPGVQGARPRALAYRGRAPLRVPGVSTTARRPL